MMYCAGRGQHAVGAGQEQRTSPMMATGEPSARLTLIGLSLPLRGRQGGVSGRMRHLAPIGQDAEEDRRLLHGMRPQTKDGASAEWDD
jgi:hypothetical protein